MCKCNPWIIARGVFFFRVSLFVDRFVCKNTGVLFETDILQVGIKSEFKDGKGKN